MQKAALGQSEESEGSEETDEMEGARGRRRKRRRRDGRMFIMSRAPAVAVAPVVRCQWHPCRASSRSVRTRIHRGTLETPAAMRNHGGRARLWTLPFMQACICSGAMQQRHWQSWLSAMHTARKPSTWRPTAPASIAFIGAVLATHS
jgi:hypothetical protein